jgi:hypothetical protein
MTDIETLGHHEKHLGIRETFVQPTPAPLPVETTTSQLRHNDMHTRPTEDRFHSQNLLTVEFDQQIHHAPRGDPDNGFTTVIYSTMFRVDAITSATSGGPEPIILCD